MVKIERGDERSCRFN